ncbi:MAG: hypothetical protein ACUVQH_12835 [Thermogutta sp.]
MAEKNLPHSLVPDNHGFWPAPREQVSAGVDDCLPGEDALPTLVDFIPRRGQPLGMLLTGIAAVGLLLAGYRGFGANPPAWVSSPLAAFNLEGPGNLASWFSSLVLTAAGIYALIVWWILHWFYREKNGVWLVAAACWFLMGMDESAGLHLAFAHFISEFLGSPSNSALWWLIPSGIVFVGIVSRLLVDLKESFGSLLWMGLALGAYFLSVVVQVGIDVASSLGCDPVIVEELGELAGHWFLLMANVSFAAFLVRGVFGVDPRGTPPGSAKREGFGLKGVLRPGSQEPHPGADPSVAEDPLQERGDVLIIHPPHGYGPPRTVRRIVRPRKKNSSSPRTTRKRSDLDLPSRRAAGSTQAVATGNLSAQPNLGVQNSAPAPNLPAATNAFLAGMACAEAQKTGQLAVTGGLSVSPADSQMRATGAPGNPANRSYVGQQPSVTQPSQHLGYPQPSMGIGHTAPHNSGPRQASTDDYRQGTTARLATGVNENQLASPANGGVQSAVPQSPIQLPARKLTKEEKKRLKQLYKQRLAQQSQ